MGFEVVPWVRRNGLAAVVIMGPVSLTALSVYEESNREGKACEMVTCKSQFLKEVADQRLLGMLQMASARLAYSVLLNSGVNYSFILPITAGSVGFTNFFLLSTVKNYLYTKHLDDSRSSRSVCEAFSTSTSTGIIHYKSTLISSDLGLQCETLGQPLSILYNIAICLNTAFIAAQFMGLSFVIFTLRN